MGPSKGGAILLLCFLGSALLPTSAGVDLSSFKHRSSKTPRLRRTRTNTRASNDTSEIEEASSPYDTLLSGKNVRVVGEECGGEYAVEDDEAILLTSPLRLFSTHCENTFKVKNENSSLILKDLSLLLRINCKYEFLQITSDAMSGKYCSNWKYDPHVSIRGKEIKVTYMRKLFKIYGGFTLAIATRSKGGVGEKPPLDDLVTREPTSTMPPPPEDMSCPECGQKQEIRTRIVGGTTAEVGEFPFIVFLLIRFENDGPYMCGGTLLTTTTVLTAAHCLVLGSNKAPEVEIKAGIHDLDAEGSSTQTRTGSIVKSHERYDDYNITHDIAIIVVSEPFVFNDFVQPVCLPTLGYPLLTSGTVTAIGWGVLEYGAQNMPSKLQKVNLDISSFSDCNAVWSGGSGVALRNDQVCAYKSGKDTCSGDSGGPLLLEVDSRWVIYGITSYGYECAKEHFPGVYTRVSSFLPWIHPYLSAQDCPSPT